MTSFCKKFLNAGKETSLKLKKITSSTCALILAGILSSYTLSPSENSSTAVIKDKMAEYYKVQEFVYQNICLAMEEQLIKKPGSGHATKYFSRCPSGYEGQIITKQDSVKTDRFVNGKIVFYKGCSSIYVCDFKVCVATNFIMLRSSGKNYTGLTAWIDSQNKPHKTTIVKN